MLHLSSERVPNVKYRDKQCLSSIEAIVIFNCDNPGCLGLTALCEPMVVIKTSSH